MIIGFNVPKDDDKYTWTRHVKSKMLFYRMSPSLVKRVIKNYKRKEEGIAPGTVAVMRPISAKRAQEYWVMYVELASGRRRVVSAWRYPGVSPVGGKIPIPDDIREELEREFASK